MTPSIKIGRWRDAPRPALQPSFAIGDVHGRDDLLAALLESIRDIIAEDQLQDSILVLLGDYIDRGPQSIEAFKRALDLPSHFPGACFCLPGNHEQLLRGFLASHGPDRERVFKIWSRNGGAEFMRELGFEVDTAHADLDLVANAIVESAGQERLDRLLRAPNHIRRGDYLFVHAGIHPGIGLSMLGRAWEQLPCQLADEDADPLWIRGPFLTYEADHEQGVVVIHGHTPRRNVEFRANRIGIDTGAYATGCLSAVQLLGSKARIIQAIQKPRRLFWGSKIGSSRAIR